jgi:hypothetical protein
MSDLRMGGFNEVLDRFEPFVTILNALLSFLFPSSSCRRPNGAGLSMLPNECGRSVSE